MRDSAFSRLFWWIIRALPLIIYVALLFSPKYVLSPIKGPDNYPPEQVVDYVNAPGLIDSFIILGIDDMPTLGINTIFEEYFHIPDWTDWGLYGAYLVYIEILKLIVTVLTFIPKWANSIAERWSV